eukprot:SAG31_NODE_723_length_12568_cov_3.102494_9_plen_327_part_00
MGQVRLPRSDCIVHPNDIPIILFFCVQRWTQENNIIGLAVSYGHPIMCGRCQVNRLSQDLESLKKLNVTLEAECRKLAAAKAASDGQTAQLRKTLAEQETKAQKSLSEATNKADSLVTQLTDTKGLLLAARHEAAEAGRAAAVPCEACAAFQLEVDMQRQKANDADRIRLSMQQQIEQLKATCAEKEQNWFDQQQACIAAESKADALAAQLQNQSTAVAEAEEQATKQQEAAASASAEIKPLQEKLQRFADQLAKQKTDAELKDQKIAMLEQRLSAETDRVKQLRLELDVQRDKTPDVAEKNALKEKVHCSKHRARFITLHYSTNV